jgi:hypothetical protein
MTMYQIFQDFPGYFRLQYKFSMFINHFCRSVWQGCNYLSRSSGDNVDMFYAFIESVFFHIFFGHFGHISCPRFCKCISNRYVCIAFWASSIFVVQSLCHKFGDVRKPTVRQRKFSDFIRVGCTDNFCQ